MQFVSECPHIDRPFPNFIELTFDFGSKQKSGFVSGLCKQGHHFKFDTAFLKDPIENS